MTNPILPDILSQQHKFQWDINSVKIEQVGANEVASVQVRWKDNNYTIRFHKDGHFNDLREAQKALQQQIDIAILLMARYASQDVKELTLDHGQLTKSYKDQTKFKHRAKQQKVDFEFEAQREKNEQKLSRLNPQTEEHQKTTERIVRINEAAELKKLMGPRKITPPTHPIVVQAEAVALQDQLKAQQAELEATRQKVNALEEEKRQFYGVAAQQKTQERAHYVQRQLLPIIHDSEPEAWVNATKQKTEVKALIDENDDLKKRLEAAEKRAKQQQEAIAQFESQLKHTKKSGTGKEISVEERESFRSKKDDDRSSVA